MLNFGWGDFKTLLILMSASRTVRTLPDDENVSLFIRVEVTESRYCAIILRGK